MATVRIRILESHHGSPDGVCVVRYLAGETHDMPEDLATVFVREGWGEVVRERKDAGPAPENKAIEAPPENRGLSAFHKGSGPRIKRNIEDAGYSKTKARL